MFEIFVPTNIKNTLKIQDFPEKIRFLTEEKFSIKWNYFDSKILQWFNLTANSNLEELIIISNWSFGSRYFIDYDWQNNNIEILGNIIMKPEKLSQEINNITNYFDEIKNILNSNNLLTFSKKDLIIDKIKDSYFTLSWLIFNLYNLLSKTEENLNELQKIQNNKEIWVEFSWNSIIFKETLETKKIELEKEISNLELRTESFIDVTKKFLI